MKLEDAIIHCEEVANDRAGCCEDCANEHRQFAEWLKDYKRLKEKEEPKMINIEVDTYRVSFFRCPSCNYWFDRYDKKLKYCYKCGQALKWEVEK